jgi:hypothetical protein
MLAREDTDMIGSCCGTSDSRCHAVVVVGVVPALVTAGAVFGLVKLFSGVGGNPALPSAWWIPLVMLAAVVTLWGLWLGFTAHGRSEPLLVGMFGLGVTTVGFFVPPLVLPGVLTVLAAAVWSATSFRRRGRAGTEPVESACGCGCSG